MEVTDVPSIYSDYSQNEQDKIQEIIGVIVSVSEDLNIELTTSIKWNQLSFSCQNGTPIRVDRFSEGVIGIFVHCQTTLVEEWREIFGGTMLYSKTRAILLDSNKLLPEKELEMCIQMALNYKKRT
ncbi:DUF1801 domain-containing protein [Enterococcus sp. AZ126]|uniref:DUF1801 domain-containing protein n=1 Tax=Enterococcus sp. AZ126 TaxID=2774635 RepID=UPI003F22C53F